MPEDPDFCDNFGRWLTEGAAIMTPSAPAPVTVQTSTIPAELGTVPPADSVARLAEVAAINTAAATRPQRPRLGRSPLDML